MLASLAIANPLELIFHHGTNTVMKDLSYQATVEKSWWNSEKNETADNVGIDSVLFHGLLKP